MRVSTLSLRMCLVVSAACFAACGGDDTPQDVTTVSMMNPLKFVANSLTVPTSRDDSSIDMNGDGKKDNQLGNIIGALAAQGLKTQDGVNTAFKAGSIIILFDWTSAVADHGNDPASGVTVQIGKAQPSPPPKFDGSDQLTPDPTLPTAQFAGRITNGAYSSNSPVTTTHPVNITIQIPLVANSAPVNLSLVGAHIQFKYMAGTPPGLMSGELHGAIKATDVQTDIVPKVADLLNMNISKDPTSATNKQILQIFDTGGTPDTTGKCTNACLNPDGTCAMKGDGKISVCEVQTNAIIKNVLNPDVQMFDAAGNYHPNPDNTTKDSLSLGIAFTGIQASF